MPLAKSKKSVGLGNALMKDRFGKGKGSDKRKASAIARKNHATGEQYLVNEKQDAAWVKMRSVTEQGDLDEFLATAELAGTDFVAEKMNNVEIIHTDQKNPYLLSEQEERVVLGKHRIHKARLTVLRRPKWDASTTPRELDALERESFLIWRRGLAELQEHSDLLITPFERNIEVWRQLWRVIERSDVIVQIVDARNPLLFRSEDLESYVTDVDANKKNLLLINKADMMTLRQRQAWAKYLKQAGVKYKFFSAHLAKELNESKDWESDSDDEAAPSSSTRGAAQRTVKDGSCEDEGFEDAGGGEGHDGDEETRILTVEELEDVLLRHAPVDAESGGKLQVGLVGYPNVGKSSTINALMGAKKVSVSSTPGKTKHFQTMHLSERVVLCDCPGLVFPNFALTKAALVCNGVLPIDQMREYTGPVGLVTQRIPQRFLEAVYGIRIHTRPLEEGGTGVPTAEELLQAYAEARGFRTQGLGQPDQSRAARYVLKDYVNGKLLFVQPPPDVDDEQAFNRELYGQDHLPEARCSTAMALGRVPAGKDEDGREDAGEGDEGDEDDLLSVLEPDAKALPAGPKTAALDASFFRQRSVQGHLKMPFSHRHAAHGGGDAGKLPSGRKARTLVALERGIDAKDVQLAASSKKHFKGGSRSAKGKKCRGVQLAAAQ